jgi:hypothetical protein
MASKATQEHFTGCVTSIDLAIDLAERVDSITPAGNVKIDPSAGHHSSFSLGPRAARPQALRNIQAGSLFALCAQSGRDARGPSEEFVW